MTHLSKLLQQYLSSEEEALAEYALHIPEDSVCAGCGRLVRHHPGLERILAVRRLKYYDERRQRLVTPQGGIPYCNCGPPVEQPRPRYAD